jgi:FkbM family methyltransferase
MNTNSKEKIFSYPKLNIGKNEFEPSELIQIDTELSLHEIVGKDKNSIKTIVIVGAWHGDEVDSFLQYKNANIFCFEPNPETFSFLKKRFDNYSNVYCLPFACGSTKGPGELNENNITGTDSILPTLNTSFLSVTKKHSVDICRLDDIEQLKSIEIDLLWLDVQGFELEVLKGANLLLQNCQVIFTEVSQNNPDYKNAVTYDNLNSYLDNIDFKLLAEGLNGNNSISHSGNALFVKKNNPLSTSYFNTYEDRIISRIKKDILKRNLFSMKFARYISKIIPLSVKLQIKKFIK